MTAADEDARIQHEEGEPYPEISYGALVPERLTGGKMEKKMKKIVKEGGKRGVEIEGAADMGGLQFFCTTMQEPNGDVDLLYESLKAMNAKSDANEEERKGGSGRVGKMLVSPDQDNSKLALVAYCPPAKQGVLKADQWMKDMVKALGGGDIVFSDATTAKMEIKNNADKGLFVLKLKDSAITESINYLKCKGLFPDNKDDDDSDYVFGDDDFPTAESEEAVDDEFFEAEEEEEVADFGDDPLAMLGGMGEEEVYKVTLMEDQVAEDAPQQEEEEAVDFGDDPLAMLGGMGEEEVYKVTLMEDQVAEDAPQQEAAGFAAETEGTVEEAAKADEVRNVTQDKAKVEEDALLKTADQAGVSGQDDLKIKFLTTVANTQPGDSVYVVGDLPGLGAWSPAKGLLCKTTAESFPVWTSDLIVDAAVKQLEFKLVVSGNGAVNWEEFSCNRKLELPGGVACNADISVSCHWGKPEVFV
mmetsp:Transcript_74641/g.116791  ORF Transcript_74641/g.116791 Transcript_74641/m.116791 type:complete len:472 (+) Transcript_74641:75-1490(+)